MGFALTEWSLFVDESGSFDKLARGVIVAGVLVDREIADTLDAVMKKDLQDIVPSLPWPIHFAHFNLPLVHVLALRARRGGTERVDPAVLREADIIWGALDDDLAPERHQLLLDLRQGEYPKDLGRLKSIQNELRRQRRTNQALRALSRYIDNPLRPRVRRLLTLLGDVCPERKVFSRPFMLVAASETRIGERGDPRQDPVVTSAKRYRRVFASLAQRVVDLVAMNPGSHHIECHVLTRHAEHGRDFDVDYLEKILATTGRPEGVEIEAISAPRYEGGLHSFLVLADFVANTLRVPITEPHSSRSPADPLERLEHDVYHRLRLPVLQRTKPPTCRVSASGAADELILAAVEQPPELVPAWIQAHQWPRGYLPWARAQAENWAIFLGV